MIPRTLRPLCMAMACMAQASCLFWHPIPPGAYSDGYAAGCEASKQKRGYVARDEDPRSHLQERYSEGWTHGYASCEVDNDFEEQSRAVQKTCSKHDKKRGRCK
ncbi:hypothetical protein [Pseudomonas sp. RIT-PI-S]|uniref:hypothetical protein n=1 Tax=Pseudomonas sp. RIT-PI-S TaxID=3035295 RepID=UPI0021DACAFB|nr:hypothetical protein [Pseudomonas sp. RIT-PI-S]